jgi:hypothetical protein
MRFNPRKHTGSLRSFLTLIALICAVGRRLRGRTGATGNHLHSVGTITARREDVLKIERYLHGGWGRGKTTAVGALIGFGGGFAIGATAGGCRQGQFGPCITRGTLGGVLGAAGAVIGAGI